MARRSFPGKAVATALPYGDSLLDRGAYNPLRITPEQRIER